MTLSRREVDQLIKAVSLTKSNEIDCDDCLRQLAEFAERALAGKSVSDGLRAVEHHLAICAECHEEYEALLLALESQA